MLPKFSNPLIELCEYVDTASTQIYIAPQKRQRRLAQDHSCIRVKPRLCGATRRQATGDYNGISSRLAYELRSPSSAPLCRPRASQVPSSAHPGLTPLFASPSISSFPFLCMSLAISLSLFLSFSLLSAHRCVYSILFLYLRTLLTPESWPPSSKRRTIRRTSEQLPARRERCPRCGEDFANGNEGGPNGSQPSGIPGRALLLFTCIGSNAGSFDDGGSQNGWNGIDRLRPASKDKYHIFN